MMDKVTGSSGSVGIKSTSGIDLDRTKNREEGLKQIEQFERQIKNGQSKEQLEKVVDSMNQFLTASNTHLKFEFHDELREYYVTVVDDVTQEVIKEIPSKKMLDKYASKMSEALGIVVDQKI